MGCIVVFKDRINDFTIITINITCSTFYSDIVCEIGLIN
jgi:hypothetical protein